MFLTKTVEPLKPRMRLESFLTITIIDDHWVKNFQWLSWGSAFWRI